MKTLVIMILISIGATVAQAKDRARICWSVLAAVDTMECKTFELPLRVQKEVQEICNTMHYSSYRNECLAKTENQIFSEREITYCGRYQDSAAIRCFEGLARHKKGPPTGPKDKILSFLGL